MTLIGVLAVTLCYMITEFGSFGPVTSEWLKLPIHCAINMQFKDSTFWQYAIYGHI